MFLIRLNSDIVPIISTTGVFVHDAQSCIIYISINMIFRVFWNTTLLSKNQDFVYANYRLKCMAQKGLIDIHIGAYLFIYQLL